MIHKIGLILAWFTAAITLNGVAVGFSILASIVVIISSAYKIRLDRQQYKINLEKKESEETQPRETSDEAKI